MHPFLQRTYGLIQKLQPQAPAIRRSDEVNRDRPNRDWLPPVMGPSDWSCGLMQAMVDNSTAWYFDRR